MLASHLKNPKASSFSDVHLNKFLNSNFNESITRVADTPMDTPFVLRKKNFCKG